MKVIILNLTLGPICLGPICLQNNLFSYYLDKVCQIEANEILICFQPEFNIE